MALGSACADGVRAGMAMREPVMRAGAGGRQEWRVDGRLHRLDGPAVIDADGYQAWYVDGQRHRLDGPAVIDADGSQQWYAKGRLHRLDGPAVVWPDGTVVWLVHGRDLTGEITRWMQARNITWPWDEATQMEFALTWL